jgi:hypothetical protein
MYFSGHVHIPLKTIVALVVKLSQEFRCEVKVPKHKVLTMPSIDKRMCGATLTVQARAPSGMWGWCCSLYSETHYFKILYSLGRGTNMKAEIFQHYGIYCSWSHP